MTQEPEFFLCITPNQLCTLLTLSIPHGWDQSGSRCKAVTAIKNHDIEIECTCGKLGAALRFGEAHVRESLTMTRIG